MIKFLSTDGYHFTGQTYVCIWLQTQTFTQGKLYVACSQIGKPENLAFTLTRGTDGQTIQTLSTKKFFFISETIK